MQLQWCSGPNSSECEGISLRNLDEKSREEVRQYLQGDVGSRKHFVFRRKGGASREKDLEGYRREREMPGEATSQRWKERMGSRRK